MLHWTVSGMEETPYEIEVMQRRASESPQKASGHLHNAPLRCYT